MIYSINLALYNVKMIMCWQLFYFLFIRSFVRSSDWNLFSHYEWMMSVKLPIECPNKYVHAVIMIDDAKFGDTIMWFEINAIGPHAHTQIHSDNFYRSQVETKIGSWENKIIQTKYTHTHTNSKWLANIVMEDNHFYFNWYVFCVIK